MKDKKIEEMIDRVIEASGEYYAVIDSYADHSELQSFLGQLQYLMDKYTIDNNYAWELWRDAGGTKKEVNAEKAKELLRSVGFFNSDKTVRVKEGRDYFTFIISGHDAPTGYPVDVYPAKRCDVCAEIISEDDFSIETEEGLLCEECLEDYADDKYAEMEMDVENLMDDGKELGEVVREMKKMYPVLFSPEVSKLGYIRDPLDFIEETYEEIMGDYLSRR